jgi:1-phosphatidylinositol-3-phosphate 5-kinase
MLRVCNLCLEKIQRDDDEDDDHRSVISNISSSFPHHLPVDAGTLGYYSQSPFAASQLFGRSDEPFNLYSIAETRRQMSGSEGSGLRSRPMSPAVNDRSGRWERDVDAEAAPFRRGVADDDEKDPIIVSDPFGNEHSISVPRSATKTPDFPSTIPFPTDGTKSTITFPASSPEHGLDSPHPSNHFRSRVNSYAETEIPTPFLRSRVQSRLGDLIMGEAGWRTRRESTA